MRCEGQDRDGLECRVQDEGDEESHVRGERIKVDVGCALTT